MLAQFAHAEDQLARGERLYQERCGACHSLDEHGAGLIGRKAGTQPGFDYSAALVPGNKMIVQLANDLVDRAAIIAYLDASTRVVSD